MVAGVSPFLCKVLRQIFFYWSHEDGGQIFEGIITNAVVSKIIFPYNLVKRHNKINCIFSYHYSTKYITIIFINVFFLAYNTLNLCLPKCIIQASWKFVHYLIKQFKLYTALTRLEFHLHSINWCQIYIYNIYIYIYITYIL